MSAAVAKKRRDADVTQQIKLARDELDKALQESADANQRLCSTLPPKDDSLEEAQEGECESH